MLGLDPTADVRLLPDPGAHLMWVVAYGETQSIVQSFDTRDLQTVVVTTWPRVIYAAAPLSGRLYVSDPTGIRTVRGSGVVGLKVGADGDTVVRSLVADPSRHRLLALASTRRGPELLTLDGQGVSFQPAPTDLVRGAVTVTGAGQIWAGGYGSRGPVLVRLDPVSLRVDAVSDVVNELGPEVDLLAAGTNSLLVSGPPGRLWCIRGADGEGTQLWALRVVRATATAGAAFATTPTGLYRLRLTGCSG